jgi:CxxC-x17-CxxC domain-containing protein
LTIIIDDAGSGDLLFGVVIGAYRDETQEFKYDLIDVKYFQQELFTQKEYLQQTAQIVTKLLQTLQLKNEEEICFCQGYIFDETVNELKKTLSEERIRRIKVIGEPQRLTEIAYLDEIRNLGYTPLDEREDKRAKSFFHMMRWLKANPQMLKYAKTGWPKLNRYRLFNPNQKSQRGKTFQVTCTECGNLAIVPFKPQKNRPVYCSVCWQKKKPNNRITTPPQN